MSSVNLDLSENKQPVMEYNVSRSRSFYRFTNIHTMSLLVCFDSTYFVSRLKGCSILSYYSCTSLNSTPYEFFRKTTVLQFNGCLGKKPKNIKLNLNMQNTLLGFKDKHIKHSRILHRTFF